MLLLGTVTPAAARAEPGPPLQAATAELRSAVRCDRPLSTSSKRPVLLVHGGLGDADEWNGGYADALAEKGHAVCRVQIPGQALGDAQRSVEYVVAAVRMIRAQSGRQLAVIGHSEGAFLASFALRFWPDLADDVSDVVGLAGVYPAGTVTAALLCAVTCPPVAAQIVPGSRLLAAYAQRSLYSGPSFTSVSTDNDELLTPQPQASTLGGAQNVRVQQL